MDPTVVAAGVIVGYLAGSVSFTRIVGRILLPGRSLERTSYAVDEAGATITLDRVSPNSIRERAGPRAGCLTGLLDIAKAFLPTLLFRLVDPGGDAAAACAAAAVVGHVFPVWHGFRGGYGMSPLLGGLLVLDPLAAVVVPLVGFAVGLAVADSVVAFDLWPALLLPWSVVQGDPATIAAVVVANAAYWWAERDKVRQHLAHRRATRKGWRDRFAELTFVMGGRPPVDPAASPMPGAAPDRDERAP